MKSSANLPEKQELLRRLKASYQHDRDAYNKLVTDLQNVQFELADQQDELAALPPESDKTNKTQTISQLQARITLFSAKLTNADTEALLTRLNGTITKIEQLESEITGKKVNSDSPSFLR